MNNPMDLTNKRILVTGASSGIGRETAILISKLGGQVILVGRDEERLNETLEQMENKEQHLVYPFDLTNYEEYAVLFKNIASKDNKLNGLVHCAGIAKVIPLKVVSYKNIMETMEINYIAFMELVKYFSKKTVSDAGSIVGISAVNAHYPQKCMSVYASSKGAIEMAVSTLAIELMEKNIRINAVVPGPINTPMANGLSQNEGVETNIIGQQLIPMGEPEDVANMIAFLLSDASKFSTGRLFYVDGGRL